MESHYRMVTNFAQADNGDIPHRYKLDERDLAILHYIRAYQTARGRPPSRRAIGKQVKLSHVAVQKRLQRMARWGYVLLEPRIPHGITLLHSDRSTES
jgi:SOS-response transcriptional repressor LexA